MLNEELEDCAAARQIDPEVQRAHARLYNAIKALRDEFQADQLPVEEALAILALELISVDYAARYRPDLLRKKLSAVPRAKDRLMERRAIELAERKKSVSQLSEHSA